MHKFRDLLTVQRSIIIVSLLIELFYLFSLPFYAVLGLIVLGTFIFTSFTSLASRILFSFFLLFSSTVEILLILGLFRIQTMASRQSALIFLTCINIAVTIFSFRAAKNMTIKFNLKNIIPDYLFGFIFFIIFFISANFRPSRSRNLWAFAGWDHSGQHLAQIVDLNIKGSLYYDALNGTLYPRAIHAFIAQFNALLFTIHISPQTRLNSAFNILVLMDWLGSGLTLLLLLVIYKYIVDSFHTSRLTLVIGSLLVGWVYSSDQFLLLPMHFGWSASIAGVWVVLYGIYGFLCVTNIYARVLLLSLTSVLIINTWTLLFPLVFLLQLFALKKIIVKKSRLSILKRSAFLVFCLTLELVGSVPLILQTFGKYANTSSFAAKDYVPTFFLLLEIGILWGTGIFLWKLRHRNQKEIRFYVLVVLGFILVTYGFALVINSPLLDLYYYPAKLLWTLLLLLIPVCIVAFILPINKYLKNFSFKGTSLFILSVLLFSTCFSSQLSWCDFTNTNIFKNANFRAYPIEDKEILQNISLLNHVGPVVIWNDDRFDYVNSYWLVLSGHLTISPFDANNEDKTKLCFFLSANPNTFLISRKLEQLNQIESNCKFRGQSFLFKSRLQKTTSIN